MKSLLSLAVVIAGVAFAQPVLAQSLDITVPGGTLLLAPDDTPSFNNNPYIYRTPLDTSGNFDPAQAAANAIHHSHFYLRGSMFNVDRAITLNATGGSILDHQLACQAAYPSYDLASDTYLGSHGIPRPCRL